MRRVLLDQGFAPSAAHLLRAKGWDAVHVSDVKLDRAEDEAILLFARESNRVCITLDHDFHAHLAITSAGKPSVIFVRMEGLSAQEQADLIGAVFSRCEATLLEGAAVSVDRRSIRIRPLPIQRESASD